MRNSKDFILGFMSKAAAGLLAVFLMLPTSANAIDTNIKDDLGGGLIGGGDLVIGGVQQNCADCYKCVSYNSTTGCTECVRDVNYCGGIEELYCPDACTYFKSLYTTVWNEGYCSNSSGSVPSGAYNMLISQACSGDTDCTSCLQDKSRRYFSAICDSAELAAGSLLATNRLDAAIELSGIENCAALDIEDGDFGEVESGSGEPLPPDQCQELLDWCEENVGQDAEFKCSLYGFEDEALQNCIDLCENLMGHQIEDVIDNSFTIGVCIACGGGEYYDAASESCTACSAGTAQSASVVRHLRTSCTECKAGTYSMVGATECMKCSAGWTSTAGSGLCIRCLKGTYAPVAGSPECLVCPDGTYSDTLGASSCTSCPADGHGLTPHSLHTSLQGGMVEPEYGQSYSRNTIDSCYTGKNAPMNDTVGTYEWVDNCFYGVF